MGMDAWASRCTALGQEGELGGVRSATASSEWDLLPEGRGESKLARGAREDLV
jgi:hypothetical protein